MAKTETLPSGESWTELIGQGPMDVWAAPGGAHVDGEAWAQLPSVPVPETLPGTLRLEKNGGIRGFFRRTPVKTLVRDTRPITLEKHELHSTWPLYNLPEEAQETAGPFRVELYRNKQSYAPLDQIDLRVTVYSKAPERVKLKAIGAAVRQTVTYLPNAKGDTTADGAPGTAQQRSEIIASKNRSIRKKLEPNAFLMYDLSFTLPKSRTLMSVTTAKHIEIVHSLRVAVEVAKECIVFEHLKLQVSPFPSSVSAGTVARIGMVPALCLEEEPGTDEYEYDGAPASATAPSPSKYDAAPYSTQAYGTAANDPHTERTAPQPKRYDQYERMLVNDTASIPRLETDAAFLGTATPRGPGAPRMPLVFQAEAPRPASAANQAALIQTGQSLRPGDVLSFDGGVAPGPRSRRAAEPHTPSPRAERSRAASPLYAEPVRAPTTAQAYAQAHTHPRRPNPGASEPTRRPAARGFDSAEAEKVRLFERARAEAERYQQNYEHGAAFPTHDTQAVPAEPSGGQSVTSEGRTWHPPSSSAPRTGASTAAMADAATGATAPRATAPATRTFPSAAEEKAALYERARDQVAAYHQNDPTIVPPTDHAAAATPAEGATPAAPVASTTYAFGIASDADAGGAPSAATGAPTTTAPPAVPYEPTPAPSAMAPAPVDAAPAATSRAAPPLGASDEKQQMRRYYAAQDAVAQHLANEQQQQQQQQQQTYSVPPAIARPAEPVVPKQPSPYEFQSEAHTILENAQREAEARDAAAAPPSPAPQEATSAPFPPSGAMMAAPTSAAPAGDVPPASDATLPSTAAPPPRPPKWPLA